MMRLTLCLLVVGMLGLSGSEDVRVDDYMPLVYNFYDMIAEAACVSKAPVKPTMVWAIRRNCGAEICREVCSVNRLRCFYGFIVKKTPKILHADSNKDEGIDGLGSIFFSEDAGCTHSTGCGPNYCCCEGEKKT
ncbi:uncharacterized protein LOC135475901 [Liolophura sinensis]|uniref:uncharacterized protein LOC135475901 n=1 Tax=Liolophura sinensis TaxID=3198878 RepID=UPI00315904E0